jgi:DNA-binding MarR family transcriptional regulator
MAYHTTRLRLQRHALRVTGPSSRTASPSREAALRTALDGIRRILRDLRVSSRAAEQELGLSGAQLFVLQQLAQSPAESLNELAERTRTHQSSVSVVVSRLVARGLVSRDGSIEDGRRITIALTSAGRAVLRRAPEAAQARLTAALERLPRRGLVSLADGLGEVARLLDEDERTTPFENGRYRSRKAPVRRRRA